MAVFVCLLLFHNVEVQKEREHDLYVKILHSCVPNDTVVWKLWTEKAVKQLQNVEDKSLLYLKNDEQEGDPVLSEEERKLLGELLDDAGSAFRGYIGVCDRLPDDSSQQMANGKA